jgi:aryl sulfotransferase
LTVGLHGSMVSLARKRYFPNDTRLLTMLVRPAEREYRTWVFDSRRWDHYRPRPGDIVISTYPKCGTTWTQRIVGLLIFQDPAPLPLWDISAWIDRRIPEPIEDVIRRIEAQTHRRFLKSHIPADGLPIHDDVRYIHVARDGRDACMSFHNHGTGFSAPILDLMDQAGMEDEMIGRPYPRIPADPAAHFHSWLTKAVIPGQSDGLPAMSFFEFERSWWELRERDNLLMVHYNDLMDDLPGEIARIAKFLDIDVPETLLPQFVEAAGFKAMRRDGSTLLAKAAMTFQEGSDRFFHKGSNRRWEGIYTQEDLDLYDSKTTWLSPECRQWVRARSGGCPDPTNR